MADATVHYDYFYRVYHYALGTSVRKGTVFEFGHTDRDVSCLSRVSPGKPFCMDPWWPAEASILLLCLSQMVQKLERRTQASW